MDNKEVVILAQAAQSKAQDAHHLADKALTAMATHEKTCAERYQNIKDAMAVMAVNISNNAANFTTSQSTMQNSINNLSNVSHESIGKWKGISYVSTAVLLTIGALKLAGLEL